VEVGCRVRWRVGADEGGVEGEAEMDGCKLVDGALDTVGTRDTDGAIDCDGLSVGDTDGESEVEG
jgi:hypothetical protein